MNKTINGRVYSFGTLPAIPALHVEVVIAKAIGEPLFKAFATVEGLDGKTKEEKEKAMKEAGMAAMALIPARLDPNELLTTMETVFKYVTCDGKRLGDINDHFTGKNRELWEVFIEALRHNFSDFLPASLFGSLPVGMSKE